MMFLTHKSSRRGPDPGLQGARLAASLNARSTSMAESFRGLGRVVEAGCRPGATPAKATIWTATMEPVWTASTSGARDTGGAHTTASGVGG
jgi:hypothetical protein